MITVLVDGSVYRQVAATLASRRWAMDLARTDPRSVKVWESGARKSTLVFGSEWR
jgi:hypothetical protein